MGTLFTAFITFMTVVALMPSSAISSLQFPDYRNCAVLVPGMSWGWGTVSTEDGSTTASIALDGTQDEVSIYSMNAYTAKPGKNAAYSKMAGETSGPTAIYISFDYRIVGSNSAVYIFVDGTMDKVFLDEAGHFSREYNFAGDSHIFVILAMAGYLIDEPSYQQVEQARITNLFVVSPPRSRIPPPSGLRLVDPGP